MRDGFSARSTSWSHADFSSAAKARPVGPVIGKRSAISRPNVPSPSLPVDLSLDGSAALRQEPQRSASSPPVELLSGPLQQVEKSTSPKKISGRLQRLWCEPIEPASCAGPRPSSTVPHAGQRQNLPTSQFLPEHPSTEDGAPRVSD